MAFSISDITRSGSTATATTASPHGLSNGDTIGVVGADQPEYNIVAVISGVTPTTWDYTVSGTPVTPATGTILGYVVSGESGTSETFSLGLASGAAAESEVFSLGLSDGDGAKSEMFSIGLSDGDGGTSEGFALNTQSGEPAVSEDFSIPATIPAPVADFIGTPLTGFEPLTVDFTSLVTQPVDTYTWDFGDPASGGNNTSALENPSHVYSAFGDYTVSLTVTNITGFDTEIKTDYISVLSLVDLLADFITTGINSVAGGIQVDFQDQSVAPAGTTFFWEFGDGNTSTLQNPSNTYATPGVYQVTLTVTNGPFSDQICKTVTATTQIPRFIEIWGTVTLAGGIPVEANKIISVGRDDGTNCADIFTDTSRTYRTVDDAGTTRFVVRARGDIIGIPNSGFADGESVRIFIGGRLAIDANGDPIEVPFFQTLPSTPQSHIDLDVVFPAPITVALPAGGIFGNRVLVSLVSDFVTPSTIFYTLDGSDPKTSGTRIEFTAPFELTEGTTVVQFYTEDPLGTDEETKTETYVVQEPTVIPSLPAGDYSSNQEVILTGNRPGVINISTNGGPFEVYDGFPILIEAGPSGSGTVVIDAFLDDTVNFVTGPTDTFTYNVDLVRPVITSLTINNGDPTTINQLITVQVDASSFTNSVTGLLLSEVPDFTGATVQLYAPEITFQLSPGDGVKELYAQVSDQLKQFSVVKMTSINMNTFVPEITVSAGPGEPISDSSFVFTGTKSANSGVLVQITANGNVGSETLVIPIDQTTEWSYNVALSEGTNEIKFQSITEAQNQSTEEIRTVEVILVPEGLTTATTLTTPEGTWRIPFVLFEERGDSHVFALLVEANFGSDPVVLFPLDEARINERVITVSGTADPGSIVTVRVVEA